MNILKKSIIFFIFLLSVFDAYSQTVDPQGLSFTEYVDDNTLSVTGKLMHVCESGVMSGIHVKNDDQVCFKVAGPLNPNKYSPTIDVNTTIDPFGTRVCPAGYAMVGVHVKDNFIKCAAVFFENRTDWFFGSKNSTIRYNMHACPLGSYMIGWQKPTHNLICRNYQFIF
jgi:hypothetical protein